MAFANDSLGRHGQLGELNARRLRHIEHERQEHADQHAELDRDGDRRDGRQDDDPGVESGRAQVVHELMPVDQSPGREHQNAGEARLGNVEGVRRKQEHGQRDGRGRDHARPLRSAARLLVDRRARERARAGEAVKHAADDVGHAFAQALLIDIELLPRVGGDRLGHRNRFEQPEQRDRQSAAGQRVDSRPFDSRQFERRQIGRNLADDFDALLVEMPIRDDGRHADDCQQQIGQPDVQPRVDPAQARAQWRPFPIRSASAV